MLGWIDKGVDEGIELMNRNPYANGSCIFTESGYYSREFARRTHAGMVGINVGIPVPVSFFPFSGHKDSFFGDNHVFGRDGMQFYTETKCVTTRWFDEFVTQCEDVLAASASLQEGRQAGPRRRLRPGGDARLTPRPGRRSSYHSPAP